MAEETDFDGVIDPDGEWADIPRLSNVAKAIGGEDGNMNAQAVAIAKRLATLAIPMRDYDALRSFNGKAAEVFISAQGTAGQFQRDDLDSVSQDNGGTVIVDDAGRRWKRRTSAGIDPRWFGAVAEPDVDNTEALQRWLTSSAGASLVLPDGLTFGFCGVLEIPVGCVITGGGILRRFGSGPVDDAMVVVSAGVTAAELNVSHDGTYSGWGNIVAIRGGGVRIGKLRGECEIANPLAEGGIVAFAGDFEIGEVHTRWLKRGFAVQPVPGGEALTGFRIDHVDVHGYVRGLYVHRANTFNIGGVRTDTAFDGIELAPGRNAILLENVSNYVIGDCDLSDAIEHSFRIGGTGDVFDFKVGTIVARNSGGSALKLNTDPGAWTYDGAIAGVHGVNVSRGSDMGNREVFRPTRVRDVQVGQILAFVGCTKIIQAADIQNLHIGYVYGEGVRQRAIQFLSGQDASDGDIDGFYVDAMSVQCEAGARAAVDFAYDGSTGRKVRNVAIRKASAKGFGTSYARFETATPVSIDGTILLEYDVPSGSSARIENCPNDERIQVIAGSGIYNYSGRGAAIEFPADRTFNSANFDPASSSANGRGAVGISSSAVASAPGAVGSPIILTRIGSGGRRGAAIAAKQTGASALKTGLVFFGQDVAVVASEVLVALLELKHYGSPNFPRLPKFDSNAQALSQGLVAGDFYSTTSGEVRVVV